MISVEEARALVLSKIDVLDEHEVVPLLEADGRVLATELRATRNLPAFDNSAMDGVGVRLDDVKTVPTTLRIVGASRPGNKGEAAIGPGEAMRIMTGGLVPFGVDAVVMREHTDESRVDAGEVVVLQAPVAGQHIRRCGEDVRIDAVIASAGDVVTPARMNLLLAAGVVNARVVRRPVVGILSSGDELKEVGEPAGDADVINSNAHAVAMAARSAGCAVRLLGIARDSLDDHVDKINASEGCDVLLTIGGVSMGTHDFVRPALERCGCALDMWKVAMRPGKPIAFGRRGAQRVFGLPGNPVSALVSFELFVRPALKKLAGQRNYDLRLARGVLDEAFDKKRGLEVWARARARWEGDVLRVHIVDKQGSHQVSGMAEANALARFPSEIEHADAQQRLDVLEL
jgi:molybdopterin molybdotransferase